MTAALALESAAPAKHSASAKRLGGIPRAAPAGMSGLAARLLFDLPLPPRLGLRVSGVEGVVEVGAGSPRGVSFDPDEWGALVAATEADRVWPADFASFCRRKSADPSWRLGLREALAGGQPDPTRSRDLGHVLTRLGAQLLSVELRD